MKHRILVGPEQAPADWCLWCQVPLSGRLRAVSAEGVDEVSLGQSAIVSSIARQFTDSPNTAWWIGVEPHLVADAKTT